MEDTIITLAKKKLREKGLTKVLVPEPIEALARSCPNILCNDLTEEMAAVLMNGDQLMLMAEIEFGGGVQKGIKRFFSKEAIKTGDKVLIHHCKDGGYFTTLAEFHFSYRDTVHLNLRGAISALFRETIEMQNVVAVAKMPSEKVHASAYTRDDNHTEFIRLAKRLFGC